MQEHSRIIVHTQLKECKKAVATTLCHHNGNKQVLDMWWLHHKGHLPKYGKSDQELIKGDVNSPRPG